MKTLILSLLMLASSFVYAEGRGSSDQIGLYYLLVGMGAPVDYPGMSKQLVIVENIRCERDRHATTCSFVVATDGEMNGAKVEKSGSAADLLWASLKRIGAEKTTEICANNLCVRAAKRIRCNMVADAESVSPEGRTYCDFQ